jgi:hypothetical protein
VKRRVQDVYSSRFTGVCWDKGKKRWRSACRGKHLGCHATEEGAARAYNAEAERVGRVDLTYVVPPASDADDDSTAAAAAAGVGSKRATPKAPGPPMTKQPRRGGAAAGRGRHSPTFSST